MWPDGERVVVLMVVVEVARGWILDNIERQHQENMLMGWMWHVRERRNQDNNVVQIFKISYFPGASTSSKRL